MRSSPYVNMPQNMHYLRYRELCDEVIDLDEEIFGERTPIERWLEKKYLRVLTILYRGEVVAFLAFYRYSDSVVHIWKTGVLPAYRRRGFLRVMIDHVIELTQVLGLSLTIGTSEERFPAMHAFLENSSFRRFERSPPKEGYQYYIHSP
jgi:GNAT superfamily N-acetyltransferase